MCIPPCLHSCDLCSPHNLCHVNFQSEDAEQWTIFTAALAAEKVPLTIHDYRQRLMYLRRLDHSIVHVIQPVGPFTKVVQSDIVALLDKFFQKFRKCF